MPLTFSDVEEILRIIDRFPAAEIRFEHGDVKLYVKRVAAPDAAIPPVVAPSPAVPAALANAGSPHVSVPGAVLAAATETVAAKKPAAEANVDRSGQMSIDSPLAGVYYAAPSPDADPFVNVGRQVVKGSELCIIEVMKVMNTIKAPFAGVVVDIAAENGAAVEKAQPLMWIRPVAESP